MNREIQETIKRSSFEVKPGTYVYATVAEIPATMGGHFLISRDEDEVTVVTKEENLGSLPVVERNKESYALISLNVSIPFYAVGFLATVSQAIAKEGMNVLIVSTYSKDYIFVKKDCAGKARRALLSLGFTEKN